MNNYDGGIYHPDHEYLSRCHRDKLWHNDATEIHKEAAEVTAGIQPNTVKVLIRDQ